MQNNVPTTDDVKLMLSWQNSPIKFIKDIWGLTPERDNNLFRKGKHITWQQHDILMAIEEALTPQGKKKISVVSGHGVGKTTIFAWLLIWYLMCHRDAQVPCTAPTADQLHDVLWKNVKLWINRMPEGFQPLFNVTGGYVRMVQSPETWFARAKTARKESPEALAGIHGDYVLFLIDEASGVPEEIYQTGEGSLTGENTLVLMISNGTRNEGYFYDSHNRYSHMWRTLQFSGIESPIVQDDYVNGIVEKYGEESDEYKIRVLGQFPDSENMDERGWVPLIQESQIIKIYDIPFIGRVKLGIDPAGEGSDATVMTGRDDFVAKTLAKEAISSSRSIARTADEVVQDIGIKEEDVIVDNFGEGANVARDMALLNHRYSVNAVNWGEKPDEEEYLNKRAECYMRARKWLLSGGMVTSDHLIKELCKIKYKRNERGKIKIMDKPTMKRIMGKSPDHADSFALTFYEQDSEKTLNNYETNNNYIVSRHTTNSIHDAI